MNKINVLLCCTGNICRSPMAEGALRELVKKAGYVDEIFIDSAGTHAHYLGHPPDPRAQRAMLERGIDISGQRSRRVALADFQRFDHILVMDGENYDALRFICPRSQVHKIRYLLDFAPQFKTHHVPDPFHAEEVLFIRVRDMIEQAAEGLMEHLQEFLRNEKML
ncbi:low molecular weight protein-tyrosine-phosphatase [Methylocaldum sp.]|uniref:low molecular weight protein-tyrosine-phosphatase n=1 Tax=Methylocaldum sp. TaxID=1969727 RepID=UPI002D6AD7D6|nr:low molecular weight protein-tyrosine-phosphatase [Methylocaldum sp.]HYE34995.1 low molecular weight protein-tyrosine-phosphatase [Methylocaldum sp.]